MKKIISFIIIATTLILTLASCSSGSGGVSLIKTTITAEEWAALDEIVNFTVEITMKQTYTYAGERESYTQNIVSKLTEDAEYTKESTSYNGEKETDEYYSFKKDGVTYKMHNNDGEWIASKANWSPITMLECAEIAEVDFEDITYNSSKKAYVYTLSQYGVVANFTFYFKNGILSKLECKASASESGTKMSSEYTMVFSSVNKTTITLPEYTINN